MCSSQRGGGRGGGTATCQEGRHLRTSPCRWGPGGAQAGRGHLAPLLLVTPSIPSPSTGARKARQRSPTRLSAASLTATAPQSPPREPFGTEPPLGAPADTIKPEASTHSCASQGGTPHNSSTSPRMRKCGQPGQGAPSLWTLPQDSKDPDPGVLARAPPAPADCCHPSKKGTGCWPRSGAHTRVHAHTCVHARTHGAEGSGRPKAHRSPTGPAGRSPPPAHPRF